MREDRLQDTVGDIQEESAMGILEGSTGRTRLDPKRESRANGREETLTGMKRREGIREVILKRVKKGKREGMEKMRVRRRLRSQIRNYWLKKKRFRKDRTWTERREEERKRKWGRLEGKR